MWTDVYKTLYCSVMPDQPPATRPEPKNPFARWEESFAEQMIRLRESKQLTQTDLAKTLRNSYLLPFHQQTIQRIEAGTRPVRLNEAHLIARALDADLASMTAELAPDARELSYEVHAMRVSAGETANEARESLLAWIETVEALAFTLHQRLQAEEQQGDTISADTAWGLSWMANAAEGASLLEEASYRLDAIESNSAPEARLELGVLDDARAWVDRHYEATKPFFDDRGRIIGEPSGGTQNG